LKEKLEQPPKILKFIWTCRRGSNYCGEVEGKTIKIEKERGGRGERLWREVVVANIEAM